VQSGATFADVLEARLGCTDVPPAGRREPGHRVLTAALFVFELPLAAASAAARLRHPVSQETARDERPATRTTERASSRDESATTTTPAWPVVSTGIRLTLLERRALAALNRLGAGLDEAPSSDTLRRAFRRLAHRYHPDRHPGSSPEESARLARLFAEATAHYRVLAAAVDVYDRAR